MLFNKIRAARLADDRLISVRDLTVSSHGNWSGTSCGNPLLLNRTHDWGLYFEHDEEQADDTHLMACGYRRASMAKPPSLFDQGVEDWLQRTDTMPACPPLFEDYWCAIEYHGPRNCPQCKKHIYSTEMKNRDTQIVPTKFAR